MSSTKTTLLTDQTDLNWFWNTHMMVRHVPEWCKGVLLEGNEDSPTLAKVYGIHGMNDVSVGPVFVVFFHEENNSKE